MGLDLALIPIHHHEGMGWWLGTARLPLDRDGLGHMICGRDDDGSEAVKTHPIPKKVHLDLYMDDGLKRTMNDSYGSPLKYATAGDLAKAMIGYADARAKLGDKFSPWNEAVIAFVSALPPDVPIVLYWH